MKKQKEKLIELLEEANMFGHNLEQPLDRVLFAEWLLDHAVRPVVRGKWEKHEDFDTYVGGRFVEWVCSECDKRLRSDWAIRNHIQEMPTENFCPNCGADMREVNND